LPTARADGPPLNPPGRFAAEESIKAEAGPPVQGSDVPGVL